MHQCVNFHQRPVPSRIIITTWVSITPSVRANRLTEIPISSSGFSKRRSPACRIKERSANCSSAAGCRLSSAALSLPDLTSRLLKGVFVSAVAPGPIFVQRHSFPRCARHLQDLCQTGPSASACCPNGHQDNPLTAFQPFRRYRATGKTLGITLPNFAGTPRVRCELE